MGLVNYEFISPDEPTDVEAKGLVAELREKGKSEEEILKTINAGTREHTRILLPWNEYPEDMREGLSLECPMVSCLVIIILFFFDTPQS